MKELSVLGLIKASIGIGIVCILLGVLAASLSFYTVSSIIGVAGCFLCIVGLLPILGVSIFLFLCKNKKVNYEIQSDISS